MLVGYVFICSVTFCTIASREKGYWSAHPFETQDNWPRDTRLSLTEHSSSTIKHIIKFRMLKDIGVHTHLKPQIIIPRAYTLVLPRIRLPKIFYIIKSDEKGHYGAHSFKTPNNRPRGTCLGLTKHSSS